MREVAHGTAALLPVAAGQLLTITDVGGDRAAQLFAFTKADLAEFLSPHHTRVFSNSYRLTLGMRLVTNRRRPIMVLGRDGGAGHDLLMPGATRDSLIKAGLSSELGLSDLLVDSLAAHGLAPPKLPDPVNLFLDVAVEETGRLVPRQAAPLPGRAITCRVLIDAHLVVAAGASDLGIATGRGHLRVEVRNHLHPAAQDTAA
ncbi:urea carboxylase-associated family protein [Antarcticirhabdus aurantiaca]|uniref:Urea carboxylase-associated family protein n=1 Tax=Antarcticirhabdus aurantiaca TaxID=2606717 RepID=A0ACD4NNK4_9HYPH|nr:urea carboxylase-associated family protein [Antarcticirhabdus aurantiaca]WAJ28312.1 urea carboxylase-associated family protein [Jeongeuplla avenae]